jgi:two-component system, chemotaxis family, sensor kinase Cph1
MFQCLDAEGPFPGTGGCIAIVMKIVERHGGHIWVKSREGNGATFYFALPISGAHEKRRGIPIGPNP